MHRSYTSGQLKLRGIIEEIGLEAMLEVEFSPYFVDVYLPEINVAIELDGPWHSSKKKDSDRDAYLLSNFNLKVLRIKLKNLNKTILNKEIEALIGH